MVGLAAVHGPGEIKERFDGPVKAVDLAIEHLHGLLRFGIDRHVAFEHLQPKPHGI